MNAPQTDDLCRQMDKVRRNLGHEVEEIVESARTLADWRFYLRKYPWLCLAGAATVGFLLVPNRVEIVSPSADALEKLAKRNKLVVNADPKPQAKSGLTGALLSLLVTAALRGAMDHMGRNASGLLAGSKSQPGGDHAKPNR